MAQAPDGLPVGEAGVWAQEKHELLRKYIESTWGVRRKLKRPTARPGYVDLFSGPGIAELEDGSLIEGSPIVAWRASQGTPVPFSAVFAFDADRRYADALRQRMGDLGAPATCMQATAIEAAKWAADRLDPSSYHLVFADPYNLADLPWTAFRMISWHQHLDFIVHFSVNDLTRNLERYFQEDNPILESFAPGWREHVGDMRDPVQMRGLFFEHWVDLFRRDGYKRGEFIPLITNTRGAPLYRLVCFSRHPLASKIWGSFEKTSQGKLSFG